MQPFRSHPFAPSGARRWLNGATVAAFLLPLASYWLTAPRSVSFWDCPEYVTAAATMGVGHPPGNPVWQLVSGAVCAVAPAGREAWWVNLSSGLWTALAMALLLRCMAVALALCLPGGARGARAPLCCLSALTGVLCLAWCDSVWFSSVEAEVYALSLLLTVLVIWLMGRWWLTPPQQRGRRVQWLVLTAYVTGLSLGVHQLNLLVLPALGVIYAYGRRRAHAAGSALRWLAAMMVAVGLVLAALMPGSLQLAGEFELWAVNRWSWPVWSGAVLYLVLLYGAFITSLALLQGQRPRRPATAGAMAAVLFLSGIFMIGGNIWASAILSATAALAAVYTRPFTVAGVRTSMWMLAALWTGWTCFALIPVAASSNPGLNTGNPSDIFALRDYVLRKQYGSSAPLLRGATPYSRPVSLERYDSAGRPDYSRRALRRGEPRYVPFGGTPRLAHRSGMLSASDSALNRSVAQRDHGYILADYSWSVVTTPELDMWLPRITSAEAADLAAFDDWVGMNTSTMDTVRISEALDSAGRFVAKADPLTGERTRPLSYRPTYAQNLGMFLSYQAGYMYFRYLLWNFAGRQNDFPSGGEADHGNFITGFPVIDDAMLGPQAMLPDEAGSGNPGHNVYYILPLLLGLVGILFSCKGGRSARRLGTVVLVLWLMTGLAIVVYLNQSPGEARERDYAFLGSYMAFAVWIGMGVLAAGIAAARAARLVHMPRPSSASLAVAVALLGVPALMLVQNYDDHDRTGRTGASDLARNVLNTLPRGAVLFTDGDNLTFPLWYAQQVGGVRRDVAVVNLSYLSMPSYSSSLPVRMSASPSDLRYGGLSLCAIPAGGDTLTARQLLEALMASPGGTPVLASRYVEVTPAAGEAFTVDLRQMGSGAWLRMPQLVMLDIMATSGRPVYWVNGVPGSYTAGLPLRRGLFTSSPALDPVECALRAAADTARLLDGGCSVPGAAYYDPATARMMRWQRANVLRAAVLLADSGLAAPSLALTDAALARWPFETIPPDFMTASDTVLDERLVAASLLQRAGHSGRAATLQRADSLRNLQWLRYIEALPPRLRPLTSPQARTRAARAQKQQSSSQ